MGSEMCIRDRGRQDVRLNQEENENDTEEFGAIFLLIISYENIRNSNLRIKTSFRIFLKIFEKSSSYREEFSVGTEKKVRPIEMFECSSFRDFFCLKRACKLKGP